MTDSGSMKILIYAFNYAERMLEEVPYLRYSAERSLCFLPELRDPGVRIVAITSAPVDPYTLEYHFRDLFGFTNHEVESARERLTLLTPRSHEPGSLDSLVVGDDRLMEVLRRTAKEGPPATIVNFIASRALDELAREIHAEVEEGDHPFGARWGSKAGGKELLLRAGVAVPGGSAEVLRSEAALVQAIERVASGPRPYRRVLVKLNGSAWAASIGNVLIDCERLRRTGDLLGSAEVIRLRPDDFRRELAGDGAIVEEYLDGVASSPSGLGHIGADGAVSVIATHDQVLSQGQYWGCRFPADERWRPVIADAVGRTGAVLAGLGHRGTFGVDFVATEGGAEESRLLAVEINLRKVGPSHVVRYAEGILGRPVGEDGLLRRRDGQPVCYVHGRLHDPSALEHLDPESAVERLRAEGLLYRHDTAEGVALHVLGALSACGFVELTSLAPSFEAAEANYAAAEAALRR